jgi:hypothetical protein
VKKEDEPQRHKDAEEGKKIKGDDGIIGDVGGRKKNYAKGAKETISPIFPSSLFSLYLCVSVTLW